MSTYYLLETAGTMEWEKIGLFESVDEAYHWLGVNYGFDRAELVEDAKNNYDIYEIRISELPVLNQTHDIDEDC